MRTYPEGRPISRWQEERCTAGGGCGGQEARRETWEQAAWREESLKRYFPPFCCINLEMSAKWCGTLSGLSESIEISLFTNPVVRIKGCLTSLNLCCVYNVYAFIVMFYIFFVFPGYFHLLCHFPLTMLKLIMHSGHLTKEFPFSQ